MIAMVINIDCVLSLLAVEFNEMNGFRVVFYLCGGRYVE